MTFLPATASALLDGLNPQQREAVEYRGPALLIVAGAGSGKTSVLTRRIASLIASREAWPSQILAITFTNKAATEMRERVQALLGQATEGMWISTFHSACVRILRKEIDRVGFKSNFSIYDAADSKRLMTLVLRDLDLISAAAKLGLAAVAMVEKVKPSGIGLTSENTTRCRSSPRPGSAAES